MRSETWLAAQVSASARRWIQTRFLTWPFQPMQRKLTTQTVSRPAVLQSFGAVGSDSGIPRHHPDLITRMNWCAFSTAKDGCERTGWFVVFGWFEKSVTAGEWVAVLRTRLALTTERASDNRRFVPSPGNGCKTTPHPFASKNKHLMEWPPLPHPRTAEWGSRTRLRSRAGVRPLAFSAAHPSPRCQAARSGSAASIAEWPARCG